jgi:hypothetical protein
MVLIGHASRLRDLRPPVRRGTVGLPPFA